MQPRLAAAAECCEKGGWHARVDPGERLTYAYEILRYNSEGPAPENSPAYETDLLVYDARDNGDWIPRVVLGCKKGSVTTHDALTYRAKAETHKRVHPYLRYGILVGDFDTALPGRLLRHGAYFGFMMVWASPGPDKGEWREFVGLL